jgi:hypothetical protein
MARTNIPVQDLPVGGLAALTWTNSDSTNDHDFLNDGSTILIMRNSDAATKAVTIKSVTDDRGRTGDIAITVPATTGLSLVPLLPPALFNVGGRVQVDLATSAAGFQLAAVRISHRVG